MLIFLKRTAICLYLLLLVGCFTIAKSNEATQQLSKVKITIGILRLTVEVANTPDSRAKGLMFRKSLPEHTGMVFVFPEETVLAFWMKNTTIPLSVIFVNKNGIIVSVKSLVPYSENPVSSSKLALYAIELNRGECERYNIKPGMRVDGLSSILVPLK